MGLRLTKRSARIPGGLADGGWRVARKRSGHGFVGVGGCGRGCESGKWAGCHSKRKRKRGTTERPATFIGL